MKTLLIGGARSGKSRHAEQLADRSGRPVTVVATAQAGDEEMRQRIALHRKRRPPAWNTIEEPLDLGRVLSDSSLFDHTLLIDCMTLWLSNTLDTAPISTGDFMFETPAAFTHHRARFFEALERRSGDVILVSNEIGWGVVPMGASTRWFVDEAGRLNQALAERCDRVVLVAAGLPLVLKDADAAVF